MPKRSRGGSLTDEPALARVVGVPGAVLMGLGSILGTGLFVSIGIAAGIAGPSIVLAVALAALVATFNGLSSAQLAANHPVSGGTYEYGYRYLGSYPGFLAGWMFLFAKSSSGATAALGFAGYLISVFGRDPHPWEPRLLALALVLLLTALVAGGIERSSRFNAAIVSFTLLALFALVAFGLPGLIENRSRLLHAESGGTMGLLHATALMFVAYTGYGRVATLGEEIRDPYRNIPKAIVITLLLTMALYLLVTAVSVAAVGAEGLGVAARETAAPLEAVAMQLAIPGLEGVIAVAAVTAMVGVMLNLLLGLSRVMLAMSRRGDLPRQLAAVGPRGSPRSAVLGTGALIAALVLLGDVKTTWSFSAFTVLVYYAITNLAALRLSPEERRFPRWVAASGLASCLGLAFFVERDVWLAGLALILFGTFWHHLAKRLASKRRVSGS